jgi:hypothetical protein
MGVSWLFYGLGPLQATGSITTEQFEAVTYAASDPDNLGTATLYQGDQISLAVKITSRKGTVTILLPPTFQLFDALTGLPVAGFENPVNVTSYDASKSKTVQAFYRLDTTGIAPGKYRAFFTVMGQMADIDTFTITRPITMTITDVP